ncbi:MAG: hypothetical protein LUG84_05185 [Akkermansiaceae bacterium]|nr:hypothetical protein [Akkermansiaceae bacterium]
MLQKAGITHAGVEYLMRDHYLNGGPGGLERVLNNALGLPRNANEKQRVEALKNFKGRENELRVKIRDARAAEYNRIAMVYPSKRRFLAGWGRRNRRTYEESAFMG